MVTKFQIGDRFYFPNPFVRMILTLSIYAAGMWIAADDDGKEFSVYEHELKTENEYNPSGNPFSGIYVKDDKHLLQLKLRYGS